MTTANPAPAALEAVGIFAECSPEELAAIAAQLELVERPAGNVIFREGEPGTDMYVIASGQVRLVSDTESEKVIFAHLGPGECFGEMALLTGAPRSAAAIGSSDVRLWRLDKDAFERVVADYPQVNTGISRILAERVSRGGQQRFQNEAASLLTLTPERETLTIGRWDDNDLVLPDPQVGGVHARVQREDGRWVIYDLDSDAGTYVNRRRVKKSELTDGDEILDWHQQGLPPRRNDEGVQCRGRRAYRRRRPDAHRGLGPDDPR